MNIVISCSECKKDFQVDKYKYNARLKRSKSGKVYCSPRCSKAEKSRNSFIEVKCDSCGMLFKRQKNRVKHNIERNSKNLCSPNCKNKYFGDINTKYVSKTKEIVCTLCSKIGEIPIYRYNKCIKKDPHYRFCCSFDCASKLSPTEDMIKRISDSQKGISVKSRGREGHIVTEETKKKLRDSYYRYERQLPNLDLVHDCMNYLNISDYETTIDIIPDAIYCRNNKLIAVECQRGTWKSCIGRKLKAYDTLAHNYNEVHIFWLDAKNDDKISAHYHWKDGKWNKIL